MACRDLLIAKAGWIPVMMVRTPATAHGGRVSGPPPLYLLHSRCEGGEPESKKERFLPQTVRWGSTPPRPQTDKERTTDGATAILAPGGITPAKDSNLTRRWHDADSDDSRDRLFDSRRRMWSSEPDHVQCCGRSSAAGRRGLHGERGPAVREGRWDRQSVWAAALQAVALVIWSACTNLSAIPESPFATGIFCGGTN